MIKKLFFILLTSSSFLNALEPAFLNTVLKKLPEKKEYKNQAIIEKIPKGWSNENFKISFPDKCYFVRRCICPKLLGVLSEREFICTKIASSLGIAPEVVLFLKEDEVLVLPYIESKSVEIDPRIFQQVVASLKILHKSDKILPTQFCPFNTVKRYLSIIADTEFVSQIPLNLKKMIKEIKNTLPKCEQLVPCHLDLFSQNILDDGERIWLIDWEYSAMSDPLFDLATWVSSDNLSADQMKDLLEIYFKFPTSFHFSYLYLMSIIADTRWALWCLIQAKESPIDVPYEEYSRILFKRIEEKTNNPLYCESLKSIQNSSFIN